MAREDGTLPPPAPSAELVRHDFTFNGHPISVTSSATAFETHDISDQLREPEHFHGDVQVHDLVRFGPAFAELRNEYIPKGLFLERDKLPDQGIIIMSDHYREANRIVAEIDELAQRLAADKSQRLYNDPALCEAYLGLTKEGYKFLESHLPEFFWGEVKGKPVSLERAGLVTTRLARGLELDDEVPGEIRVVTKRAHHKDENIEDLMVSVKWRNPDDLPGIQGEVIDVADFVNPASGASITALIMSARARGIAPDTVVHRAIMATSQGIALARRFMYDDGIGSLFYTLGVSSNLTPEYYLTNPGVGDAGHVLRHFLPNGYSHE